MGKINTVPVSATSKNENTNGMAQDVAIYSAFHRRWWIDCISSGAESSSIADQFWSRLYAHQLSQDYNLLQQNLQAYINNRNLIDVKIAAVTNSVQENSFR